MVYSEEAKCPAQVEINHLLLLLLHWGSVALLTLPLLLPIALVGIVPVPTRHSDDNTACDLKRSMERGLALKGNGNGDHGILGRQETKRILVDLP